MADAQAVQRDEHDHCDRQHPDHVRSSRDWVTVDKPELVAAAIFRAQLAKQGVKVVGSTVQGRTPTGATVLASDDLDDAGQPDGPVHEAVQQHARRGAHEDHRPEEDRRPGTWSAGTAAIVSWLKAQKLDTGGLVLRDGSGLSRSNRIKPLMITFALVKFTRKPWFATFRTSLPVAANPNRMVGGTLRLRMVGTAAAGKVRAKTGTLTGVTALSGYITDRDGRVYAFSMISNYSGATPRPVEDKVAATVAAYRS